MLIGYPFFFPFRFRSTTLSLLYYPLPFLFHRLMACVTSRTKVCFGVCLPCRRFHSKTHTHTVETRARVCYGVKWTVARGSPITGGHSEFVFRLRLCFAGRRSARVSTLRLEGKTVVARCLGFWSVGDWCLH